MSLLSKFGAEEKFKNFALVTEDPEAVKSKSSVARLVKGKRVQIPGSFNGHEVPTFATLESAYWSRLTVQDHEVRRAGEAGRMTQTFGGAFKEVKIKVELDIDGQMMTLEDFLTALVMESAAPGTPEEEVLKNIKETGILKGIRDGMPLFFQQMGANANKIGNVVEVFKAAGAIDTLHKMKNPRFNTAWDLPVGNRNLEVVSFELGSANRKESQTGQGFIDIVEAVTENLNRVLSQKAAISILKKENESGISQGQIKANNAQIKNLQDIANKYSAIWSGTSQRTQVTPTGDKVKLDIYDASNVPCGRWTVFNGKETIEMDVWSNPNETSSVTAAAPQVDTKVAPF